MKHLNKYFHCFSIGIKNSMEYREDFLLGMFGTFFPVFIQYFLWRAIYKNSATNVINGYTFREMVIYITLASCVAKLISTGFEDEIASDVKEGGLSKFIVQPISYFFYRVFCFLGEKFIYTVATLILLVISCFLFRTSGTLDLRGLTILFFILSLVMSMILNYFIFYTLSIISFWSTEVWGIFLGANVAINIASGGILPIEMFGEKVMGILNFLPFKYTINYTVNIIQGKIGSEEIIYNTAIQFFWILVFINVSKFLWKKGMKKYVSIGG